MRACVRGGGGGGGGGEEKKTFRVHTRLITVHVIWGRNPS